MRKQLTVLFLALLVLVSGCGEDCSNVDCIQEPFLFKLTNQEGQNLLDNGTLALEQVSIYNPDNPTDSLRLFLYAHGDETWVETHPTIETNEYVLLIDGHAPYNLTFDLDQRSGECCSSLTIQEAYLNGTPIPHTDDWRVIILP